MDERHLQVFVSVVDAGSLSKAAASRMVTPQAVSQQVRDLERELGARLLERTSQGVRATGAGRAAYDGAREVLSAMDRLRESVYAMGDEGARARPLRLGASKRHSMSLFDRFIGAYLREDPGASVEYVDVGAHDMMAALQAGRIDAVECMEGAQPVDARFVPLLQVGRSCLVSVANPLARLEAVTPRDLKGVAVYVHSLRWTAGLAARFAEHGYDGAFSEAPSSDVDTVLELCMGRDAVFLCPSHLAEIYTPLLSLPLSVDEPNVYGIAFREADAARLASFEQVARRTFAR